MHLVLLTAIVEPIINAAKYLDAHPEFQEASPLIVEVGNIRYDRGCDRAFDIRVGNAVEPGTNIMSLGIRDTEGVIESTNVANYREYQRDTDVNGAEILWMPIRMTPMNLAREMYKAWRRLQ